MHRIFCCCFALALALALHDNVPQRAAIVDAVFGVVLLSYDAYKWSPVPGSWNAESRGWLLVPHHRSLRSGPSLNPVSRARRVLPRAAMPEFISPTGLHAAHLRRTCGRLFS